jgi:hypothetical protein
MGKLWSNTLSKCSSYVLWALNRGYEKFIFICLMGNQSTVASTIFHHLNPVASIPSLTRQPVTLLLPKSCVSERQSQFASLYAITSFSLPGVSKKKNRDHQAINDVCIVKCISIAVSLQKRDFPQFQV